jgi:hypothetical protein
MNTNEYKQPKCKSCDALLISLGNGTWQCPNGHGVITLLSAKPTINPKGSGELLVENNGKKQDAQ